MPADRDVGATLIRRVRPVPVRTPVPASPEVDVRIDRGTIMAVAPGLRPRPGEQVVDAAGRWLIPGLWDQHVHLGQWVAAASRLDLAGTAHPAEVTRIVATHITGLPAERGEDAVVGAGFRLASWPRRPTVAELDAVSGEHPVALVSGDGHTGWLNSRALRILGVPDRSQALDENEWFAVYSRLGALPGAGQPSAPAYRAAAGAAAARGLVGIVDMEFAPNHSAWPERAAAGVDQIRVRAAVYPDRLDEVIAAGLRSGQHLPGGADLLTMGPLKIIADGSLNSRTAFCFEPYADAGDTGRGPGTLNYPERELADLLRRAHTAGLDAAVHAIGDAAVAAVVDAYASSGAAGTIEHCQLIRRQDAARLARFRIRASVQPAHLLDDRDVTERCWPDRLDRCFPLRTLLAAGVDVVLGSDAPVAPLDPWLAMAAAVHRSADEREPWNPAEAMTAPEALAASTDGRATVAPGGPADLALLEDDPLAPDADSAAAAARLRSIRVAATFVAGRATHLAL